VVRFMSAAPCTGAGLFFANSTVPPTGVLSKCVRPRGFAASDAGVERLLGRLDLPCFG
jgi:hypothetical protein